MTYYVFVYDPDENSYFCVGEFLRYECAAKEAQQRTSDYYTRPEDVKILVHVPGLDDWRKFYCRKGR